MLKSLLLQSALSWNNILGAGSGNLSEMSALYNSNHLKMMSCTQWQEILGSSKLFLNSYRYSYKSPSSDGLGQGDVDTGSGGAVSSGDPGSECSHAVSLPDPSTPGHIPDSHHTPVWSQDGGVWSSVTHAHTHTHHTLASWAPALGPATLHQNIVLWPVISQIRY